MAELAGPADLAEFEPGLPLGCVGVEYAQEPLYRFQSNAAELNKAKVLEVAPLAAPPAPRLLIFSANLPSKQYGAAVVNQAGKVCGVFAEFAATEGDAGPRMHYGPLVDRDLILHDPPASGDVWVEPVVPPEKATPQKTATPNGG